MYQVYLLLDCTERGPAFFPLNSKLRFNDQYFFHVYKIRLKHLSARLKANANCHSDIVMLQIQVALANFKCAFYVSKKYFLKLLL